MYVDFSYQTRKRGKLFQFLIFFSYIILWITVSYQFFAKKILVFVLIYRNLCIFATAKRK